MKNSFIQGVNYKKPLEWNTVENYARFASNSRYLFFNLYGDAFREDHGKLVS
jgi:hypothetical protein